MGVAGSIVDLLKTNLREKNLLLILDNFEQVIEAAPLVSDLLRTAPYLKILVTSRAILDVYGERDFTVLPLPLPEESHNTKSLGQLLGYSALALFELRAQAVKPDFALSETNVSTVMSNCQPLNRLHFVCGILYDLL